MRIENATSLEDAELERKLAALHYFKEIRLHQEEQFQALMEVSRFIYLQPGEYLFRRGDKDQYIHFLMRGELEACVNDDTDSSLGVLIPGEVFGETAVITGSPRTASIRVPMRSRESVVFSTDFARIGALDDHSSISLITKLILYRQIVHVLRWRNDNYRVKYPDDPDARAAYSMPPFSGSAGTQEELTHLSKQAIYLAKRLFELNQRISSGQHRIEEALSAATA